MTKICRFKRFVSFFYERRALFSFFSNPFFAFFLSPVIDRKPRLFCVFPQAAGGRLSPFPTKLLLAALHFFCFCGQFSWRGLRTFLARLSFPSYTGML